MCAGGKTQTAGGVATPAFPPWPPRTSTHTVAGSYITYWQKHTGWGETDPALPLGYHTLCSLKIPHLLPPHHSVLPSLVSKIIYFFPVYFLSIALTETFLSCLAFPLFINPMLVLWVLCAIRFACNLSMLWYPECLIIYAIMNHTLPPTRNRHLW